MNPNDFEQCPIANILMKICDLEAEERCACDDVCAMLCLPLGLIIDVICMCPRYGIYKCEKCNKKPKMIITEPAFKKQLQVKKQIKTQFKKPNFVISQPVKEEEVRKI